MRFKDDILRGLRWGGVVLAVVGTGWLCYRIVTQPVPTLERGRRASTRSSAGSSTKSTGVNPVRRAASASGSRDVPLPPPAGARARRSLPAATTAARDRSLEAAAKDEYASIAADGTSNGAAVEAESVRK